VAALPRADLHARMGPMGVRLHQAACGEDVQPLVPADEPVSFVDRLELEWPIEGLEPLSFVLSRQFDRLSSTLEQADRGAVVVTTRLTLTTRELHERVLHLPAPMREARVLRTLVLLDLESHPPSAGIDVVEIRLDVTPGRILQGSLLERSLPSPESLATLLARLGALMGESRVGAPVLLDTHDARQVTLKPFRIKESKGRLTAHRGRPDAASQISGALDPGSRKPEPLVFRRFPLPLSVHVTTERGMPVRVRCAVRDLSGDVVERAGPWRMSGAWWVLDGSGGWDRDEWDVQLSGGAVCRLSRHRAGGTWDIERVLD
jgi:protein ImuB